MNYKIIVLVDPVNDVPYSLMFWADVLSEAVGIMEREWEWFIDTRMTDLDIGIINSEGECVDSKCLDDAQRYYDHRMYRIGQLERTFLDLCVPLEEREDQRKFDTNIIIGYRDNLDAHIAMAVKPGHQPITKEYLDECWNQRQREKAREAIDVLSLYV